MKTNRLCELVLSAAVAAMPLYSAGCSRKPEINPPVVVNNSNEFSLIVEGKVIKDGINKEGYFVWIKGKDKQVYKAIMINQNINHQQLDEMLNEGDTAKLWLNGNEPTMPGYYRLYYADKKLPDGSSYRLNGLKLNGLFDGVRRSLNMPEN
jgi:hypothetical protein